MPTEPSAVFLFLVTGSLVLGFAIILRYMIRHKRLVFIGVALLALVLSLIYTRSTRIEFSFEREEPVTLAAIKPKATLVKEAAEVRRKVDLAVSAKKPADFFRINSNFGFGNKEDFYERRKAATFAALGLPFAKIDGFRVSKSLLPNVKGEIADIEYWTTEPVGEFSGDAIEGFGRQGVSDGANLVCFSGNSRTSNPYRLLPAYAFNPAWVKYGDDFRHEFSVVAIDRKTGEQEYFHATRFHKGRWSPDRDYRVVIHRQTHRQAVNLIVVD
ncbi:MAG: hypothetical protein P1V20_19410 [Verrucomicrobiales bacterium]|nr:hypothetical protein [Verrucomicrobiales bacterium]